MHADKRRYETRKREHPKSNHEWTRMGPNQEGHEKAQKAQSAFGPPLLQSRTALPACLGSWDTDGSDFRNEILEPQMHADKRRYEPPGRPRKGTKGSKWIQTAPTA
jgi:hypothetical protein